MRWFLLHVVCLKTKLSKREASFQGCKIQTAIYHFKWLNSKLTNLFSWAKTMPSSRSWIHHSKSFRKPKIRPTNNARTVRHRARLKQRSSSCGVTSLLAMPKWRVTRSKWLKWSRTFGTKGWISSTYNSTSGRQTSADSSPPSSGKSMQLCKPIKFQSWTSLRSLIHSSTSSICTRGDHSLHSKRLLKHIGGQWEISLRSWLSWLAQQPASTAKN